MKLSIVIPAFNEEDYISALLTSIEQQLSTSDICYDVIVVDNGSTDSTVRLASRHHVEVISLERVSISEARNIGANACNGDVIAFLDADVRITARWAQEIQKQIHSVANNPILTGARYIIREQPTWIEQCWFQPLSNRDVSYINGGNIIISKHNFDTIGGFDTRLETGEDCAFSISARQCGIDVINNTGFSAIHDGFPRDLKSFSRREIWHGKGDYSSFKTFIHSKVAILSLLFAATHFATLICYMADAPSLISSVSAILPLGIAIFISLYIFSKDGLSTAAKTLPLCYIYLWCRSLSLIATLWGKKNKLSSDSPCQSS